MDYSVGVRVASEMAGICKRSDELQWITMNYNELQWSRSVWWNQIEQNKKSNGSKCTTDSVFQFESFKRAPWETIKLNVSTLFEPELATSLERAHAYEHVTR